MKGGFVEFSVYLACLTLLLNTYAIFATFLEFIHHFLLFLLISCGLYGILLRFRIPKPISTNFFGKNWGAYSSISSNSKVESDYVMKVVGHRSCGLDAPENSLSAVELAIKEGINVVEFDVLMTADDVPIIFHDDTLSRMTGVSKMVNETKFEEIRKLDISVKHPFGKNFRGEKIPTLDEFVNCCLNNNIRMIIDLKKHEQNTVKVINNLFKQYPKLYDYAIVSSFNPVLIYKIRAKDPKIICSLAWRPYYFSHLEYSATLGPINPRTTNILTLIFLRILNYLQKWALWKFEYYLLGLSAILLHKDIVTREEINYWTKRGIRLVAWSVNLPSEKQYFEKILEITYLTDTAINS